MPKRIPFAAEAIFAFSILLGTTVALLAPVSVLTDSPMLSRFTDFMASIVPGINKIAKVSHFPEVTRFTSAVLWASVPVQTLLCMYPSVFVPRLDLVRKHKLVLAIGWIVIPLISLYPAYMPEIQVDRLSRSSLFYVGIRHASESRAWLGIIGGIVAYAAAFGLFAFFAWWPRTLKAYRRTDKQ